MSHDLPLDHLVVAVPNLAAASAAFSSALGVASATGGSHPDHGTCNALVSLGASAYLELLGPDPTLAEPGPWARRALALTAPDVWGFAVAARDMEALASRAVALGLQVLGPSAGRRATPGGEYLNWRSLVLLDPDYAGLVPFAIDWMDSPHPSQTSGPSVALKSMIVTHPQPQRLRALYAGLGVKVPVHHGPRSSIVVTLESGVCISTWVGSAAGLFTAPQQTS